MGLALVAAVKGYSYFHNQRQAIQKKMDMLKAMGAEVIVCPTNVKRRILAPIIPLHKG
jgi:cystathionine beta-synthase